MNATDQHAGFLSAICSDPRDLGLRLIYADWLEEHDEAARAEFIRVQVELVYTRTELYLDPQDSGDRTVQERLNYLRRRERELRISLWQQLTTGFPVPAWQVGDLAAPKEHQEGFTWLIGCRRGFVEAVSCTCADWLKHGSGVVRCQPVLEVQLTDRVPFGGGGAFAWFDDRRVNGNDAGQCYIPAAIYDVLDWEFDWTITPQYSSLKSRTQAYKVLSDACVLWARGPHPERGLEALPGPNLSG